MVGRQRGSTGYESTRVRPVTINSATCLLTMRVYSLSLETRPLFQEVFKS